MFALEQLDTNSFRPLTRMEYYRLGESGAFDGERVELLEGMMVTMSPNGPPHASRVTSLTKTLIRVLGDRADVRPQLPLALSDISEPEPDLAVVVPHDYRDEHPTTALLVIEVANTSLVNDLKLKAWLYAAAGIPEYWVVDVVNRRLVVHRDPTDQGYQTVREATPHERLELVALPGIVLDAEVILPPHT